MARRGHRDPAQRAADFYNCCLELGLRADALLKPKRKKSTFRERMERVFWKEQEAGA